MSVWQAVPGSLRTSEGELVSVSIATDPRDLESLLEALARLSFPVNPQIYHSPETIVEFPAYSGGLDEVRRVLGGHGVDARRIRVADMLAELQSR